MEQRTEQDIGEYEAKYRGQSGPVNLEKKEREMNEKRIYFPHLVLPK